MSHNQISQSNYQSSAASKGTCRGCISKEDQIYIDEFNKFDIKILYTYEVNGAYVVEIPVSNIDKFVDFYCQIMKPGYWNEYIGPKTGFFAKMPDGQAWHYPLITENEEKINKLMHSLVTSWKLDTDLWKWVADVEIYRGWLKS